MTHPLLERARARTEALREGAAASEAARRVPEDLARSLGADGFWRMLTPESLGGAALAPRTWVEVIEALAVGDPAVGWIAVTSCSTGLLTGYLDESVSRAILDEDPDAALAGVFAPMGKAIPEDGGYRLTGRWKFTSGCENARWLSGGALVIEDGKPRALESGGVEIRSFVFRRQDAQVIDTWRVSGMRGSGSHDTAVEDLYVPASHTCCLLSDTPWCEAPVYRFPTFGLLAAGIAGVGLGIARAALDRVAEVARTKRTRGGRKTMAESELVQVALVTGEGELGAARAFLFDALDAAYAEAEAGRPLSVEDRARIRLAATHTAKACAQAVDRTWDLMGGSAIWDDEPISRLFRDVHVMTQHVMVGTGVYKPIGRVLLGLDADVSQL